MLRYRKILNCEWLHRIIEPLKCLILIPLIPAVVGDGEAREQVVGQLYGRPLRERTLSRSRKSARLQENLRPRPAL